MIATKNKKEFLTQQVNELLKNLKPDTEPAFGLMTPQHMVEHLTLGIKISVKRHGEPEDPPTEKQLGFQRFIKNGAILKHKPSDKTKADLPELIYDNIEEAIEEIAVGVERFYNHYEANPGFKCCNKFFGELGFTDLELFHYQHFRFHFWQFGLLEKYP
ncbi:MAG TPA: hypothetical protein ENJ95_08100 [Bacteroidetes bacterium]|nr:hypothetical protein [Bacteroidota bacterium]